MPALRPDQIDRFWRDGVLTVPGAVTAQNLAALKRDFDVWVEESRSEIGPYGTCIDGRARFDLQPGHTPEQPALRRVQAPTEVSEAYFEAMSASPMVDDVTEQNGPLEVLPGSHRGDLHPIWEGDTFTGAIDNATAASMQREAQRCLGPAGSVCLMHTRLAHASAPNRSADPRTLLICVYSAGDAVALTPNPVPTRHEGLFVAGEDKGLIRSEPCEVRRPEYPKTSFFAQQSEDERRAS